MEMDLLKPVTIQVKTPLEREIARLKGYGDSEVSLDVVKDFKDKALLNDLSHTKNPEQA